MGKHYHVLTLVFLAVLCFLSLPQITNSILVGNVYNQYTVTITYDPVSGNFTTLASSGTDVLQIVGMVGDVTVLSTIAYNSTSNSTLTVYLSGITYRVTTQVKCYVPLMGGAVLILSSQNGVLPDEVFRMALESLIKADPGISVYNNSNINTTNSNFNNVNQRRRRSFGEDADTDTDEGTVFDHISNRGYKIIDDDDLKFLKNQKAIIKNAEDNKNRKVVQNIHGVRTTGEMKKHKLLQHIIDRQDNHKEQVKKTQGKGKRAPSTPVGELHTDTEIFLAYDSPNRNWLEVTEKNYQKLKLAGHTIYTFNGLEYRGKQNSRKRTILGSVSDTYNINSPALSSNVRSLCSGLGNLVADVYSCTVGGVLTLDNNVQLLTTSLHNTQALVQQGFATINEGFQNIQNQINTVQSQSNFLASQVSNTNFQFSALSSAVSATNYAVYQQSLNVALLQNGQDQTNNALNSVANQLAYITNSLVNSQISQAIITQDNMEFLYQRQQANLANLANTIFANMAINNNAIMTSQNLLNLNNQLNLQQVIDQFNAALVVVYNNQQFIQSVTQYNAQIINQLVQISQELYTVVTPRGELASQIYVQIQAIKDMPPNVDGGYFSPFLVPNTGFAPKAVQKSVGSQGVSFRARWFDTNTNCAIGGMTNVINTTVIGILKQTAQIPVIAPVDNQPGFIRSTVTVPGGKVPYSFQINNDARYWFIVYIRNGSDPWGPGMPYVMVSDIFQDAFFIPDTLPNRYCTVSNCTDAFGAYYTITFSVLWYKNQNGTVQGASNKLTVMRDGYVISLVTTVNAALNYLSTGFFGQHYLSFTPVNINNVMTDFFYIRKNETDPIQFLHNLEVAQQISQNQIINLARVDPFQALPPFSSGFNDIFNNPTYYTPLWTTFTDGTNVQIAAFALSKAPPLTSGLGSSINLNPGEVNGTLVSNLGNKKRGLDNETESEPETPTPVAPEPEIPESVRKGLVIPIPDLFHMTSEKQIKDIVDKFYSERNVDMSKVKRGMKKGTRPNYGGDNQDDYEVGEKPIYPEYIDTLMEEIKKFYTEDEFIITEHESLYYPIELAQQYNATSAPLSPLPQQPQQRQKRSSSTCYNGIQFHTNGVISAYSSFTNPMRTAANTCIQNADCMYVGVDISFSLMSSNNPNGYLSPTTNLPISLIQISTQAVGSYSIVSNNIFRMIVPPSLNIRTLITDGDGSDGIYGLSKTCGTWNIACQSYTMNNQNCWLTPNLDDLGTYCGGQLAAYGGAGLWNTPTTATQILTQNALTDMFNQCKSGGQTYANTFPCPNCGSFNGLPTLGLDMCVMSSGTFSTTGYYDSGNQYTGFPNNAASANLQLRPLYGYNNIQHLQDLSLAYSGQQYVSTSQKFNTQFPCLNSPNINNYFNAIQATVSGGSASSGHTFPYNSYTVVTNSDCSACTPGYGDVNGNPIYNTDTPGQHYFSCPTRTDVIAAPVAGGTNNVYDYATFIGSWPNFNVAPATVIAGLASGYGITDAWYMCVPLNAPTVDTYLSGQLIPLNFALPYFFNGGDIAAPQGYSPKDMNVKIALISCPLLDQAVCASNLAFQGLCGRILSVNSSITLPGARGMAFSCQFQAAISNTSSSCTLANTIDSCIAINQTNAQGVPIPICAWTVSTGTCSLFNEGVLPGLMYNQQLNQIPAYNMACSQRQVDSVQSCTYDNRCYMIQSLNNQFTSICVPIYNYQEVIANGFYANITEGFHSVSSAIQLCNRYNFFNDTCTNINNYCYSQNTQTTTIINYLSYSVNVPATPPAYCSSVQNLPSINVCNNKVISWGPYIYSPGGNVVGMSSLCKLSSTGSCQSQCNLYNYNVGSCLSFAYCYMDRTTFQCFNSDPAILASACGTRYANTPTAIGSNCLGTNNLCTIFSGQITLAGATITNSSGPPFIPPPPYVGGLSTSQLVQSECIQVAGKTTGLLSRYHSSTRLSLLTNIPASLANTCQNYDPGTGWTCYPLILSPFNSVELVSAADPTSYTNTAFDLANQQNCLYTTLEECLANLCMWVSNFQGFCLTPNMGNNLIASQGSRVNVYSFGTYQATNMVVATQINITYNDAITSGLNPDTDFYIPVTNTAPYPTDVIIIIGPIVTPCNNPAYYSAGFLCCPTPDCATDTELIYGNPNHPKFALINALEALCGVSNPSSYKQINTTITISCVQLAFANTSTSSPNAYYMCEPFILPYVVTDSPFFPLSSSTVRPNEAVITTANGESWHVDAPDEETTMIPLQYFPPSSGAPDPSGQSGYILSNQAQFPVWRDFQDVLPKIAFMGTQFEIDTVTYYFGYEISTPLRNISITDFLEVAVSNNVGSPNCPSDYNACKGFTKNSMTVYNTLSIVNQSTSGYLASGSALYDNVISGWGTRPPIGVNTIDKSSGTSSIADVTSIREIQAGFAFIGQTWVKVQEVESVLYSASAYATMTTTYQNGTVGMITIPAVNVIVDDKYIGNIPKPGDRFIWHPTAAQNGNPGNLYGASGSNLNLIGAPGTYVQIYSAFPGIDVENFFNNTFNFDPLQVVFVGDNPSAAIAGADPTSPDAYCGSAIGTYTLSGGYNANTFELATAMSFLNLQGLANQNQTLAQFWLNLIAQWSQKNVTDFVAQVRLNWQAVGCVTNVVDFYLGNTPYDFYRNVLINSYISSSNMTQLDQTTYSPNGTISNSRMLTYMNNLRASQVLLNCGNCQLVRNTDGTYAPPSSSQQICNSNLSTSVPPVANIQIRIDAGQANNLPFCTASAYYAITYNETDNNTSVITYTLRPQLATVTAYIPIPDQLVVSQVILDMCPIATNATTVTSITSQTYLLTLSNIANSPITFKVVVRDNEATIFQAPPLGDPCNKDLTFTMDPVSSSLFSIPVCPGVFFILVQNNQQTQNCTEIIVSSLDYTLYFNDQRNRIINRSSITSQVNLYNSISALALQVSQQFNTLNTGLNEAFIQINFTNINFNLAIQEQNQQLHNLSFYTAIGFTNTSSQLQIQAAAIGNVSLSVVQVNDSVNSVDNRLGIVIAATIVSDGILAGTVNQTIANTASISNLTASTNTQLAKLTSDLGDIESNLTKIANEAGAAGAIPAAAAAVYNITSATQFSSTGAGQQQNQVNINFTVWNSVLTGILGIVTIGLATVAGIAFDMMATLKNEVTYLYTVNKTQAEQIKDYDSRMSHMEDYLTGATNQTRAPQGGFRIKAK